MLGECQFTSAISGVLGYIILGPKQSKMHPGICCYCGRKLLMSKEHVVPRLVGGTLTIKACEACNKKRGHSGTYPPFVKWVKSHKSLFKNAVAESHNKVATDKWLVREGLKKYLKLRF